jgi:glycosyltransferase involved in cell wall biosynthesis
MTLNFRCPDNTVTATRGRDTRLGAHVPLISIVIVVLNGSGTISRALDSIKSQAFRDFELIIIDGMSTDNTVELLCREPSIDYWVSEQDQGIYDAMNKAVAVARGKWVYFLGADDTLCDSLGAVAEHFDDEWTIYYGNVHPTGSRKIYNGPFGPWRLSRHNICSQAIFYPRSLFESQRFSLQYPVLADWEFNLRCYSNPCYNFQHIPVTVANFNNADGVSSTRSDEQFQHDRSNIIRECLPPAYYVLHRLTRIARVAIDRLKGKLRVLTSV